MSDLVPAFYVVADGKKYGPFFNELNQEAKRLKHLKGITIIHVMLKAPEEKKSKKRKKSHPELFNEVASDPCKGRRR